MFSKLFNSFLPLIDIQTFLCYFYILVGNTPEGYVRGRPILIYGGTTTPVPQIRTLVAPAT